MAITTRGRARPEPFSVWTKAGFGASASSADGLSLKRMFARRAWKSVKVETDETSSHSFAAGRPGLEVVAAGGREAGVARGQLLHPVVEPEELEHGLEAWPSSFWCSASDSSGRQKRTSSTLSN
jgi:hypothetical protein